MSTFEEALARGEVGLWWNRNREREVRAMSGVLTFECPVHGRVASRVLDGAMHADPTTCPIIMATNAEKASPGLALASYCGRLLTRGVTEASAGVSVEELERQRELMGVGKAAYAVPPEEAAEEVLEPESDESLDLERWYAFGRTIAESHRRQADVFRAIGKGIADGLAPMPSPAPRAKPETSLEVIGELVAALEVAQYAVGRERGYANSDRPPVKYRRDEWDRTIAVALERGREVVG